MKPKEELLDICLVNFCWVSCYFRDLIATAASAASEEALIASGEILDRKLKILRDIFVSILVPDKKILASPHLIRIQTVPQFSFRICTTAVFSVTPSFDWLHMTYWVEKVT